ncbi:MAG: ribonuclease R [Alphaproteobacteria bacterium]
MARRIGRAGGGRPGAGRPGKARPDRTRLVPSRSEILKFVEDSGRPVDKREVARAFGITGAARRDLNITLRELEGEGAVVRGRGRKMAEPGAVPEVAVVDIVGRDADGEVIARPAAWRSEAEPPKIYMAPERPGTPSMTAGMKVLARLRRLSADTYEGRPIRVLTDAPTRLLGVYERDEHGNGWVRPTERRERSLLGVAPGAQGEAAVGDLVLAELRPGRHLGERHVRIVERIGATGDPGTISLISIHTHGIPHEFPAEAVEQAERAAEPTLAGRVDLRDVPLVTIDGPDARDFDDAVWAEPDADAGNPGGWHVLVAIADVSWYVRPGGALDSQARARGNSVYFPDRVVPMLPEALSNGLCSLRPNENRGCLAVHMWLDADGELKRHRFERGLMRSAARLTYEQVQTARDGLPDDATGPLLQPVIEPLYGAFAALLKARHKRGTLEIDLPERQVLMGEDGRIRAIIPRARLDSHRLIEEFMVAANVAAAEALERAGWPCMYRIHDRPDEAKVEALTDYLADLDIPVTSGQLNRPKQFTQLLSRVADGPFAPIVNELVLRAQAQAVYSPENIGHFGLGLKRYAHFTSPIRRYADLLVHRALVSALRLGEGGLPDGADAAFPEAGEHISTTERRAAAAEREALERYTAAFLAGHVGELFAGRVTGVTRFGLFVRLENIGADGLVPVSTLPADFYDHDERRHELVGRRTGRAYRLGVSLEVRLAASDPVTGGLLLHVTDDGEGGEAGRNRPQKGRRMPFGRARRRG